MADLNLTMGADLVLTVQGDLGVVKGDDFIRQRIVTALMTNPTEYDANGEVSILGDHLYAPNFGVGIARDVDSVHTAVAVEERKQRIRQVLRREPGVDQTTPPKIQVSFDRARQIQYIRIEYVTINGIHDRIGLKV